MAKSKIGGQAVLEGVMMRGESSVALSVRNQRNEIVCQTKRIGSKKKIAKIPFLRGIVNLISSFKEGSNNIMKSTEVWAEEEQGEEVSATSMTIVTVVGVLLGFALAFLLFIWLPEGLTSMFFNIFDGRVQLTSFGEFFRTLFTTYELQKGQVGLNFVWNFSAGLIKVMVFVVYLKVITLMPEIKRLFMYHGAEHKTINCFESEMSLTVENVQKCSTYHDRCGTAFIFFVIMVSIIVTSIVQIWLTEVVLWQKALLKLALLLPVVSLSYELLMFNAKHEWAILKPLKWLGRSMQRLSTRQPDDSMVEVAISSFNLVLEMDRDKSIQPIDFPKIYKVGEYMEECKNILIKNNVDDLTAVEWAFAEVLRKNRSEILSDSFKNKKLLISEQKQIADIVSQLATHKPLQYILGTAQFMDYEISVDENTLIPRPETEELTEIALKYITKETRVLDMCTGSGCIAVALCHKTNAFVDAVDVDKNALSIAKKNIEKYNLTDKVKLIESDLFDQLHDKYDVIISNPPYISQTEYKSLNQNVIKFEPQKALVGLQDGLEFYIRIKEQLPKYLTENGVVLFECGKNQAEKIKEIYQTDYNVTILKDLSGIERFVVINRL